MILWTWKSVFGYFLKNISAALWNKVKLCEINFSFFLQPQTPTKLVEDLNEIIKKEHIDDFIKKENINDISFQSPSDFSVSLYFWLKYFLRIEIWTRKVDLRVAIFAHFWIFYEHIWIHEHFFPLWMVEHFFHHEL